MAAVLPLQMSPRRFVFIILAFVLSLHYLLTIVFKDYDNLPSFTQLGDKLGLSKYYSDTHNATENDLSNHTVIDNDTLISHPNVTASNSHRANATFVFLCRNSDLPGVVASIQQMEDRFNRQHGYPWVLLNEEPFTEEFKEYANLPRLSSRMTRVRRRVRVLTDAPVHFGQIPAEHWYQPEWIDEEQATANRLRMMAQGIIYAGSVPYRNMCRFNSGFFFRHELLQPYRYYWRVEPDVKFFCDVTYDPFKFMEANDKVYGFTISLVEWEATIPTLWSTVKEFIVNNPEYVSPDNSIGYISGDHGESYNLCHYWSNFEIADMDFWRGEAYQKFFEFLESKGGFYYERWGDAPVHSIAVSLFARKEQVHFFGDIGYRHEHFQHCPTGNAWAKGRCACDPKDTFDYHVNSCLRKYESLFS